MRVFSPLPTSASKLVWNTALADWSPRVLFILLTVVTAASLGPTAFGRFAASQAVIQIVWTVVDSGLGSYGVRATASEVGAERQVAVGSMLSLTMSLAVAVSTISIVLCVAVTAGSTQTLFLVMLPFMVLYSAFPDWALRGTGDFARLRTANFAVAALWGAGVSAAVLLDSGPVGYALAWSLSPLGGVLICLPTSRRAIRALPTQLLPHWARHLRNSARFALAGGLSGLAPPIAMVGLSWTGTQAAAGAFALGNRVSLSAANAGWLLLQNGLPGLMRRSTDALRRLVDIGALLGVVAGLGIVGATWAASRLGLLGQYDQVRGWLVVGLLFFVVWIPKLTSQMSLIAGHLDWERVGIGPIGPAVTGLGVAVAWATHSPWIVVAAFLGGEVLATACGKTLLGRGTP